MAKAPSLLVCYGRQFYKLHELVWESKAHGISKRIPIKSIPEGLQKGVSKIFAAHPDAIIKVKADGKSLHDLAYDLYMDGFFSAVEWQNLVELTDPYWNGETLQPFDFVPACMLSVSMALSQSPKRDTLVGEYDVEFCMGIIGYSPFSGFQWVAGKDDEGLPEEIAHLDGYVEAVHVIYDDGEEDGTDTE